MPLPFCANISLFPPRQKRYFKLPGDYCELARQERREKEQFLSFLPTLLRYLCTLLPAPFAQGIPKPPSSTVCPTTLGAVFCATVTTAEEPRWKDQTAGPAFLSRAKQHTYLHPEEKDIWDKG